MKNLPLVILTVVICVLSYSCLKNGDNGCQAMAPETEEPRMKAFADSQHITYTRLPSSLYYQVIDSGYGKTPDMQSSVSVLFTGALLDGSVFDQATTPVTVKMTSLIDGWKQGLPLLKKGGRIKLIVPSYLGYGCSPQKGIPANSVLYFDIKLTDVQ